MNHLFGSFRNQPKPRIELDTILRDALDSKSSVKKTAAFFETYFHTQNVDAKGEQLPDYSICMLPSKRWGLVVVSEITEKTPNPINLYPYLKDHNSYVIGHIRRDQQAAKNADLQELANAAFGKRRSVQLSDYPSKVS